MKKLILTSAFLLTMLSAVPVLTNFAGTLPDIVAVDEEQKEIEYNDMVFCFRVDKENELMLTGYFGTDESVVIPETVNGYTVTGIDSDTFAFNCYVDKNVAKYVTLPDTIDYFGHQIFKFSNLVSVNIPKNLKVIPSQTFGYCENLETVVFHDNIIAAAEDSFAETDIEIPSDIFIIKGTTVWNSYYIYENPIEKPFDFSDLNYHFSKDNDTGIMYCYIIGYNGISTDIILPESLDNSPVKSFDLSDSDKSKITSVVFPETTNEIFICENSFSGSLISELNINFPCILNSESFADCKNLKTVTFKNDATIDGRAFKGCTNLTSVEFCGKANMNYYAFMECPALENITLDTSQAIAGNAFDGCKSLMNINSEPVFDSTTGDFNPKYSDFIKNNFYMTEEIGFINEYAKAQYQKIVNEVTNPDMSDIEKVKVLHDWVCNNTRYADSIQPAEYHTDASILLNDSTVCEGYAKALNLLLNYAGIETYYVNSFDHAWNIVKIGGHYFHVDSTWDDGDTVSYNFFMKSDSEIKDDGSHGSWSAYIPTSLHSFQKEGTPECKYQLGDVNTDGEISVADLVKMNLCLLNAEKESSDNLVLYDLDFDGKVDVFDMILMRQKFLNNQ